MGKEAQTGYLQRARERSQTETELVKKNRDSEIQSEATKAKEAWEWEENLKQILELHAADFSKTPEFQSVVKLADEIRSEIENKEGVLLNETDIKTGDSFNYSGYLSKYADYIRGLSTEETKKLPVNIAFAFYGEPKRPQWSHSHKIYIGVEIKKVEIKDIDHCLDLQTGHYEVFIKFGEGGVEGAHDNTSGTILQNNIEDLEQLASRVVGVLDARNYFTLAPPSPPEYNPYDNGQYPH